MKTLIFTEKPSVAGDFAKALGVRGKKDGRLEDPNHVIVWTVGHLVELLEPEDYDKAWKKWRLDRLPIMPEAFRYKPIDRTKKQLKVIARALAENSWDRLIIATDAGREGEVIARTVLLYLGFTQYNKVRRFWTSQALTPGVIRSEMENVRPLSEYDRLWRAGQARQIADWLVGMNGSRAATLRMDDLFSVGRVQTAVLALLSDRRRAREHFKPEVYWLLRATFGNDKGVWKGLWFKKGETRFATEAGARGIAEKIAGRTGAVQSVKKQHKKEPPPLLYSLTDLQQDANKRFGFSAKQTLGAAQDLYEKRKCLSYPRTDARVLGTQNADMVRDLADRLSDAYPTVFADMDRGLIRTSNKRVFNDAKLTDHHALIPLAPLPGNATPAEQKVYDLVLKRFAAAFHPPCAFEQTEIITAVSNETFRTKGKRILKPGWRAVYGREEKPPEDGADEPEPDDLPPLEKGDPASVSGADIEQKQTQPPPEYSEALLLKDMTNPARYVSEEAFKKMFQGDVGLGTQATRAQIIETLLARKYALRRKKRLTATDKGCRLIDALRKFQTARILTSPEETARWETELDRIARGQGSDAAFLEGIKAFVRATVEEFKTAPFEGAAPATGRVVGKCPACGGDVVDGKKGYGCANWKDKDGGCKFVIWKTIAGKEIPLELAETLISKGRTEKLDGFTSRKGKPFSAALKLTEENGQWKTVFDFNADPPEEAGTLGKCPACGGRIIEGERGYGCANWRKQDGACRFVIWKTIAGKEIAKDLAQRLLEKGETGVVEGFMSRKGRPFVARLKLEEQETGPPKVVFIF